MPYKLQNTFSLDPQRNLLKDTILSLFLNKELRVIYSNLIFQSLFVTKWQSQDLKMGFHPVLDSSVIPSLSYNNNTHPGE